MRQVIAAPGPTGEILPTLIDRFQLVLTPNAVYTNGNRLTWLVSRPRSDQPNVTRA